MAAAATATATAAAMALAKIERAHQMYREGRHLEALESYTEALSVAKTKAQKIALHSNRAACYLKIHDFKKAAEECTSVLELDHQHTGALMLRAQTLVTLKEYQSALFDVNRLMELNPSSEVYKNLQARLKTQLSLAPIPESEEEALIAEEELDEEQGKTDIEVPLTARCSESVSGAVEYRKTNDEAESNQQEATSEDDTNKFDGHRETRSDETETATFHAQETLAQNKNNEPLTSMQEATVACRPDTDKHASLNTKEQKAMPQPILQQKANPKEQKAMPQPILQQKANPKEQKAMPQPILQQKANPKEQKAMPQPILQQKANPKEQKAMPQPFIQQKANPKEQKAMPQSIIQQKQNPKEQKAMPQPIVQQKAIPQPVGRSRLDYSRWDQVDSDSSDDEDDDDDDDDVQPRYRFRVRTFGVCPVK